MTPHELAAQLAIAVDEGQRKRLRSQHGGRVPRAVRTANIKLTDAVARSGKTQDEMEQNEKTLRWRNNGASGSARGGGGGAGGGKQDPSSVKKTKYNIQK